MADSKIPQTPDLTTRHSAPPSARSIPVRIVDAPNAYSQAEKAQQVSGRVLPSDSKTEVKIITENGDVVTLKVNRAAAQDVPRPGQTVTLAVDPEQPGMAMLEVAARQGVKSSAADRVNAALVQNRGMITPVSVMVSEGQPVAGQKSLAQLIGQVLSLTPVSANEAQNFLSAKALILAKSTMQANLLSSSQALPSAQSVQAEQGFTFAPLSNLVSPQDESLMLQAYFFKSVSDGAQSFVPDFKTSHSMLSKAGEINQGMVALKGGMISFEPALSFSSKLFEVQSLYEQRVPLPFKAAQVVQTEQSDLLSVSVNKIMHASFPVLSEALDMVLPQNENLKAPMIKHEILQNVQAGEMRVVLLEQGLSGDFLAARLDVQGKPVAEFFSVPVSAFEGLEPGMQLELTPVSVSSAKGQGAMNVAFMSPAGMILSAQPWQLMNEVYSVLSQAAPAQAQVMMNMTPSLSNPAHIPATTLFFIAAVRGGSAESWLGGKAIEALRQAGRSDLVTRFSQEGNMQTRLGAENIAQDWRAANVPFLYDGQFQRVVLFFRQDQEQSEEGGSGKKSTRFIFDLNLETIGPLQLDGLFRASRLDLIVRSQEKFSPAMQQKLRRIYADALRQSGVSGELSFQAGDQHWVKITPRFEGSSADTLV